MVHLGGNVQGLGSLGFGAVFGAGQAGHEHSHRYELAEAGVHLLAEGSGIGAEELHLGGLQQALHVFLVFHALFLPRPIGLHARSQLFEAGVGIRPLQITGLVGLEIILEVVAAGRGDLDFLRQPGLGQDLVLRLPDAQLHLRLVGQSFAAGRVRDEDLGHVLAHQLVQFQGRLRQFAHHGGDLTQGDLASVHIRHHRAASDGLAGVRVEIGKVRARLGRVHAAAHAFQAGHHALAQLVLESLVRIQRLDHGELRQSAFRVHQVFLVDYAHLVQHVGHVPRRGWPGSAGIPDRCRWPRGRAGVRTGRWRRRGIVRG